MAVLIEHAPADLRKEVEDSFPLSLVTLFERRLDQIYRLEHTRGKIPIEEGFQETNLDHVVGMLGILGELEQLPHLRTIINFRQVAYMIALHDAGEIVVGDGPAFGPERQSNYWRRRKELEPRTAKAYVLSEIPDRGKRTEMIALYDRYINQDEDDREALLAKLIDKVQATSRTGTRHVYNQRYPGWTHPNAAQKDHVENATSILVGAGLNLFSAVSKESPQAGDEIRDFVIGELKRFEPIGYAKKAQTKISHVQSATQRKLG